MAGDEIHWVLVSRITGVGAVAVYGSVGTMILSGPVMLGATLLAGADMLVMGIIFTVLMLPLGLALWASTAVEREQNRQLDAFGVPAVAEVTGLGEWDDGESAGITLELRVSGTGFPAFETTWKRSASQGLRVGTRVTAVVEPGIGLCRVDL
ncbi:hypothetical protein [Kribbella solani]|uniref:hypothetical protein n=1 Tax=Kribbella solani TaxID=236067 RepID=UPI0029A98BA4|nr:hypothetical protein [Kribbella solani]MDX2971834.1 hypothetical protein [Kribbella solani]